ncbi:MAG: hypothetical protein ACTS5G_01840, partial [Burkholderiales bacterium]
MQTTASAVSWGAIFAGAAAAAALSLILLILGTGLGLSAVSPWANTGASAATMGISTIAWLTFTQLAASGMGGYLAGRLRTRWIAVHTDEIYFRDTAHGFLAWAVASLATAALLTSVAGSIISGGVNAGASMAGGAATAATAVAAGSTGTAASGTEEAVSGNDDSMAYFVDLLFRSDMNASAPAGNAAHTGNSTTPGSGRDQTSVTPTAEVARILLNSIRTGALPPEDTRYVGQLVAQRTGMSQQYAEKRVTDIYTRAQARLQETETATKDAADKARKATAYSALWIFVSLLIG